MSKISRVKICLKTNTTYYTCLQKNSILITNDKHFDKISKDEIIEVWSISKAIENLLS